MTGFVFSAVVLVAIAVVSVRWLWRRQRALAHRRQPGHSRTTAIAVQRFDDIDSAVGDSRCACGGRLRARAEGSSGRLRVVHTECRLCEESTDLYFDLGGIQH